MIKERLRQTSEGAEDPTLPFIDFVVCPAYKVGYKLERLQKYGLKHRYYLFKGQFNPSLTESKDYDLHKVVR